MANSGRQTNQVSTDDTLREIDILISNIADIGGLEEKNRDLADELLPFSNAWKAKSGEIRSAFEVLKKTQEKYHQLKLDLERKENKPLARRIGFLPERFQQNAEDTLQAKLTEVGAQCRQLFRIVADRWAAFEKDYKEFHDEKEKKRELYCYRKSLSEAIDLYLQVDASSGAVVKADREAVKKEKEQVLAKAFGFSAYEDFLDPDKVSAMTLADIRKKHEAFCLALQKSDFHFCKYYLARDLLNHGNKDRRGELDYPSTLNAKQRDKKFAELLHIALKEAIEEIEKKSITVGSFPKGKAIVLFEKGVKNEVSPRDTFFELTSASLRKVPKLDDYKQMTLGISNILKKSTNRALVDALIIRLEYQRKSYQATYPLGTAPIFTITKNQLVWNTNLFQAQDQKRKEDIAAAQRSIAEIVVEPRSTAFSQAVERYEMVIAEERENLGKIARYTKNAELHIDHIHATQVRLATAQAQFKALLDQSSGWNSTHVPESKMIDMRDIFDFEKTTIEQDSEAQCRSFAELELRSYSQYTEVQTYQDSSVKLQEARTKISSFHDTQQARLLALSQTVLLGQIKSILLDQIIFWSTKCRVHGVEVAYLGRMVKVPKGISQMIQYIAEAEKQQYALSVTINGFSDIARKRLRIKGLITNQPLLRHPETAKCYKMLETLLGSDVNEVKGSLGNIDQVTQAMQKLNIFNTYYVKPASQLKSIFSSRLQAS